MTHDFDMNAPEEEEEDNEENANKKKLRLCSSLWGSVGFMVRLLGGGVWPVTDGVGGRGGSLPTAKRAWAPPADRVTTNQTKPPFKPNQTPNCGPTLPHDTHAQVNPVANQPEDTPEADKLWVFAGGDKDVRCVRVWVCGYYKLVCGLAWVRWW